MSPDTLNLCLQLISQIVISPTEDKADEAWARTTGARDEIRQELQVLEASTLEEAAAALREAPRPTEGALNEPPEAPPEA